MAVIFLWLILSLHYKEISRELTHTHINLWWSSWDGTRNEFGVFGRKTRWQWYDQLGWKYEGVFMPIQTFHVQYVFMTGYHSCYWSNSQKHSAVS